MKAYLSLTSSYINKNSTTKTELINAGYNTVQPATYFTELGSFEKNINLSDFNTTYYNSDTEQKHPIYYRHIENNEKIPIAENLGCLYIEPESNLHINLNKITEGEVFNTGWGTVDGINNNTSMQYFFSMPFTPQINPALTAPDFFGVGTRQRSTRLEYTGIPGNAQSVEPLSVVSSKYFEGSALSGIKCYYDDNNNKVLAPYPDEDGYIYGLNVAGEKEMRLGTAIEVYSTLEDRATVYYCKYDFCYLSFLKEDGVYYTENFWPCLYHFQNDKLYVRGGYNDIYSGKTPVAFLRDKNDQYWCCQLSRIEQYEAVSGQTQAIIDRDRFVLTVVKVEDLPKFINGRVDNAVDTVNVSTWLSDEFEDVSVIYKRLDRVFQPQKGPNYDDGGPDAIGPGDPYEDENNAGEAVGGDANIVDDITPPDMSPNTSYENYVIENGLYGSYKLTTTNLRNYTKTLQRCRDNAWLPGELGDKFENMGNLIQENTVSVFMLPVDIEDISPVSFNVGTKAIRNTDIVSNWDEPSSVDTTSLIKKYTKEYVYDLGTISHYYDNFLDFAPYSTASLYIPYIGKVEIPINLVQSTSIEQKQLSLSIRINRTNGDILCILLSNNIPLCRWQGNCARSIALSVSDNSAILQNQFSRLVSSFSHGLSALGAAATGNVGGATSNMEQMFSAPMASGAPITTSSHMIGNAPETGDVGWMDSQLITLTVERPIWWKPYDYGELIGYPTRKIAKLSTVSGFAKVPNIHIRCSATESEKERLKAMLAEGVLF